MKKNNWRNGVMGVITGDALGCPVQFMTREEIARRGPVEGMEGYGTYNQPPGTWTDDGSMTLALLCSIREKGCIDLSDIMDRFVAWDYEGEYTPFGFAFDQGGTCTSAIMLYNRDHDPYHCGGTHSRSNGNGSLMRILPACLYVCEKGLETDEAVKTVHEVSALTHAHLRSRIGCGLYYFCVKAVLDGDGTLAERLQKGLTEGFEYYKKGFANLAELAYYGRTRDIAAFAQVPAKAIRGSGYVVDSFEAAIWCLITTESFAECLLKAVNLGEDTDTVAAIAGGLAGLYYGYEAIPADWLAAIQRREWIEGLCENVMGA